MIKKEKRIKNETFKGSVVQGVCAIIAVLVTVVLGGVALKQIKEDTNEIEKKLRMQCEEKLTDYMRPIEYVFLKQMPLTSVGKVNYRALE